ncbi:hypothetical protein FOMG_19471 [Fusarium oxysporum f. sp. melonis 26406]|uniref:Uncharacterized protein n=1 Tax=Fusarium oxysporum f. sp. melonis 26406 TaxID=1089452 RepID=W9ZRL5_FUSOX|nr:hypothetical protein FOMG_19471 [Fusarium oxysporum f. sp. melonis 26406]
MFLKDFPPWNLYVRISEQSTHVERHALVPSTKGALEEYAD